MKPMGSITGRLTRSIVSAILIALTLAFASLLYYSENIYEKYLSNEIQYQDNKIDGVLRSFRARLFSSATYIENMTRLAYEPTNVLREIRASFPYVNQIVMLDENRVVSNVEPYTPSVTGKLFDGISNDAAGENSTAFAYQDNKLYVVIPSRIAVGAGNILIGFVVVSYNPDALFKEISAEAGLPVYACYKNGVIATESSLKYEGADACKIEKSKFIGGIFFTRHRFLNESFDVVFAIRKFYATSFKSSHLVILLMFFLILVASSFSIVNVVASRVTKPISRLVDEISKIETGGSSRLTFPKTPDDELSVLARAVNRMLERIADDQVKLEKTSKLAAIGQATAMVSHDVRKPLASMKALLASLPAIKDDPAQIEKMVTAVDRNIASTNAMLNDVLDFSRDPTALDISEHSVEGVITAAASDALRNHPGSDVRIEYRLDHGDISLRIDGNRVVRVLTNILDNALDAMVCRDSGRSSGTIFIGAYRAGRDGKEMLGITVGDEGPGIPPEAMEKVFDPFFTYGKKGGTGLGLAICQRVIALHGGTIEARTREGGGAEFAIELPAGSGRMASNKSELIRSSVELEMFRREEALREGHGDSASVAEFLRLNKQRGRSSYLLVVDDEPLFRETVRHLLGRILEVREHVKVIEADSGEMGLKLCKGQECDYVITDIDLGQGCMTGYDFARTVLKRHQSAHILIHSNKRRADLDRKIREIASDRFMGFLPKPMRSEELLQFLACKTFEVGDVGTRCQEQQKRILIVNDDDALSFSFKIMLNAPGIQVLEACDVVTALKQLAAQKVDVILSDINLGTGAPSGYDLLSEVRARDGSVPFYVISGYSRDQEWPKAKSMGATGYLQLPVEQEQLKMILG